MDVADEIFVNFCGLGKLEPTRCIFFRFPSILHNASSSRDRVGYIFPEDSQTTVGKWIQNAGTRCKSHSTSHEQHVLAVYQPGDLMRMSYVWSMTEVILCTWLQVCRFFQFLVWSPSIGFSLIQNQQCVGRDGRHGICTAARDCYLAGGYEFAVCAAGYGVCCSRESSSPNLSIRMRDSHRSYSSPLVMECNPQRWRCPKKWLVVSSTETRRFSQSSFSSKSSWRNSLEPRSASGRQLVGMWLSALKNSTSSAPMCSKVWSGQWFFFVVSITCGGTRAGNSTYFLSPNYKGQLADLGSTCSIAVSKAPGVCEVSETEWVFFLLKFISARIRGIQNIKIIDCLKSGIGMRKPMCWPP